MELKNSYVLKKGKSSSINFKPSTIKLPSGPVEVLIDVRGVEPVINGKCAFTGVTTPVVLIPVFFICLPVCGDILITMHEMKYELSSKNDWKKAKKEKSLILEHYSKLQQDNPQIFSFDDSKLEDEDFELPKLEKEKSKSYQNLNVDLEWLKNEIVGYHKMKNHSESSIVRKKDLIYIQIGGGRLAFGTIIDGTPNDFNVSTGPTSVMSVGKAFFHPLGLAGKAVGVLHDKVKTDSFMKFIDERIYQNKGNGPELVQDISTESKSEDDIPDKIKKLSDLKEQGILTEQEFDKKKQELLDRM